MTDSISNSDDLIDSRDVIARIAELESETEGAVERGGLWFVPSVLDSGEESPSEEDIDVTDEVEELQKLRKFAEEGMSFPDWVYGETFIRESYFPQSARDLAEDIIFDYNQQSSIWPFTCIDWERAVRELKMDYSVIEFDGVTYYGRS